MKHIKNNGNNMNKRIINLTGQRFGRLLVLRDLSKRKSRSIVYVCLCDCGTLKEATSKDLRSEHTKSCGCLNREVAKITAKINFTKHGDNRRGKMTRL